MIREIRGRTRRRSHLNREVVAVSTVFYRKGWRRSGKLRVEEERESMSQVEQTELLKKQMIERWGEEEEEEVSVLSVMTCDEICNSIRL